MPEVEILSITKKKNTHRCFPMGVQNKKADRRGSSQLNDVAEFNHGMFSVELILILLE